MVNHTILKDALKIMTEAPDSIRRAEEHYKNKLAEIEAQSRDLAPSYKERLIAEARADRDRVVGRLMDQMNGAVYDIDANNDFSGEAFDFADPKFQSAINYMNIMGADMDAASQLNMLESFRGNPGALNALGAVMGKKGLYFADRAKDMTKTIPHSALTDAAAVIGEYQYSGEVNFDRMAFSKAEFKKAAERMGYDMSSATDPYISALVDAKNMISTSEDPVEQARNSAAKMKIEKAIQEIKTAKATGKGSVEDVFSSAIRSVERFTQEAQAAQDNAAEEKTAE